ncbi:VOC family protein [Spirillospora sp. NPDC050679]
MGHPVVHFEIAGADAAALRGYYGELFGWEYQMGDAVSEAVSAPGEYGGVGRLTTEDGVGVYGGVCGGAPRAMFYVAVPDVGEALRRAEELGGRRALGPERGPDGGLVVGWFTDPEGNLVGVAGME